MTKQMRRKISEIRGVAQGLADSTTLEHERESVQEIVKLCDELLEPRTVRARRSVSDDPALVA